MAARLVETIRFSHPKFHLAGCVRNIHAMPSRGGPNPQGQYEGDGKSPAHVVNRILPIRVSRLVQDGELERLFQLNSRTRY